MPVRKIYFIGLGLVVADGIVTYLHSTGKYGITPPVVILLLLVFGAIYATFSNQSSFQNIKGYGLLFTGITSFSFFLATYLVTLATGNASLLVATVFTSCFLLPSVVSKNWQLYRLAFQPVTINSWLLPVPYVRSNAISLHLNSIPFTIRVATIPGSEEQNYPVTAPGVKTLGIVFSELVYEEKTSRQAVDFSDITDNPYTWIFFVRELGGLSNRQLNADLSLLDNHVKTNAVVIAQRQ